MLLLKNLTVLTQNKTRQIIKDGAILVEGDKIADIGPSKKLEKKYAKAIRMGVRLDSLASPSRERSGPSRRGRAFAYPESRKAGQGLRFSHAVIDGTDKVAMPGLINAHNHAAMALLRGYADDLSLNDWLTKKIWPAEAKLKPKDIFAGTKLACQEMLRGGTTTFNNMYWQPAQEIAAARQTGLRDFVGLTAIDIGAIKFGLMEITRLFTQLKPKTTSKIKLTIAPHSIYTVSAETLMWCKKFADQNKLLLHIHLAETEDEVTNCLKAHRCRPVEYLEKIGFLGDNVIAAHVCHVTDKEIKILAKRGVSVAHCPTSNLKLVSGVMPLTKMLKAGVNVCLGTDGPSSNNNLDLLEDMKIAALIHKWNEQDPAAADAQTILDLGTINGAKALKMESKIGSLDVGKQADIILINFNQPHLIPRHNAVSNLVYSAQGADVSQVFISGRVLFKK